jgi:hypothetical protein
MCQAYFHSRSQKGPTSSKLELDFILFYFKEPDTEPDFWFPLCVKLEPKLRFWGTKKEKKE